MIENQRVTHWFMKLIVLTKCFQIGLLQFKTHVSIPTGSRLFKWKLYSFRHQHPKTWSAPASFCACNPKTSYLLLFFNSPAKTQLPSYEWQRKCSTSSKWPRSEWVFLFSPGTSQLPVHPSALYLRAIFGHTRGDAKLRLSNWGHTYLWGCGGY